MLLPLAAVAVTFLTPILQTIPRMLRPILQGTSQHINSSGVLPATVQRHRHQALMDTFGRFHDYLRVSLTERCNLRCEYCMPAEGVKLTPDEQLLNSDELIRAVECFSNLGVKKIRLTGGEPTLRKDILHLTRSISKLGIKDLGITTNGLLLNRLGLPLREAGVNKLNISLDTLDATRFERITKRAGHSKVVRGIGHCLNLGYEKIKINCVVKRGVNDDELPAFVQWTKHTPMEIRFLEYMPFGLNGWEKDSVVSYAEMVQTIRTSFPGFEELKDERDPNPTAKIWHVPGFKGRIGFITAMTDEFCGTCNRLRLTADGNVKACLFGEEEISLRDAIRKPGSSKDDLIDVIAKAVKGKKEKLGGYAGPEQIAEGKNRPMILIGG